MTRQSSSATLAVLTLVLSSAPVHAYQIQANSRVGTITYDTVLYSGDVADAPVALGHRKSDSNGRCVINGAGAGFSSSISHSAGQPGLIDGNATSRWAELRIIDDFNLLTSIETGSNQFNFLMHFEVYMETQAPDGQGFDAAIAGMSINVTGADFSNEESGQQDLHNGMIFDQSGTFIGLPLNGGSLDVTMPGSLTSTGSGSSLTVSTNVFTQAWSQGTGHAGIYVQLANVPITRSDGAMLESLGISYEFVPPPVSIDALPGCGSGSGFNLWDVMKIQVNPFVFSNGGNMRSADLFTFGTSGLNSLSILDVDTNGEVTVPIPTDLAEAASDGLVVFGTDLNGDLLLSVPAGAVSNGDSFSSLFGTWTVVDALTSPVDFLLDPLVQTVLLSQLPVMGSGIPLDVEIYSFNQATELASTFGDGTVTEAIEADFDLDGDVDEIDLDTWASNYGKQPYATFQDGDANVDGVVDGIDFLSWQRNFGLTQSIVATSTVVPEPTALCLACFSIVALSYARCSQR